MIDLIAVIETHMTDLTGDGKMTEHPLNHVPSTKPLKHGHGHGHNKIQTRRDNDFENIRWKRLDMTNYIYI